MHDFDKDLSVIQKGAFLHQAGVGSNWSINGIPNGGYLMAILARAMLRHSQKESTPLITANFVSRCVPGEALIAVQEISQSQQFDRLECTMSQQGKERIRAFGTFAREPEKPFETRHEAAAPDIAPWEQCVPMPEMPRYTLFSRLDVRLDPACAGWLSGHPADISEQRGWIAFKDDRSSDIYSILLMADSFPPPVLASHGMVAWVPTIEFSISIRNLPRSRRLKGIFRTRFIHRGILEEDGELWDENGGLIAISRQIAQFRKGGT